MRADMVGGTGNTRHMSDGSKTEWLVVRAGSRHCALPLADVTETMRPQPVASLPGLPPAVLGSATIRGRVVPVVHAAALLGENATPPMRFVTLKIDQRCVALAVDDVIGLRRTTMQLEVAMPPLLAGAADHAVQALGIVDRELLLVLEGSRLVPPDVWAALDQ